MKSSNWKNPTVKHFKQYLDLYANKKENFIYFIWNCVKEKDDVIESLCESNLSES